MATSRKSLHIFLTLVLTVSYCYGQFNAAQKTSLVDKHNDKRRAEGASNMNELVWDDALATAGQTLAETCKDGHVAVSVAGVTDVGQNLYWTTGSVNPVYCYDAWHGEYRFYNKADNTCKSGSVCGHYRMVVLHQLTKVGCGFKVCPNFVKDDGTKIGEATYVVCHYDDAPLATGSVFEVGSPCTKCSSGKFWCNNNLCKPTCTAASGTCACYAKYEGVCQNCAAADETTCTCKCTDGYLGTYCEEKCEDLPTGTNMQTSCTEDVTDDPEGYCTKNSPEGKCCPYIWERTCRATCAPLSKFCSPLTPELKTAATTGCTLTKPKAPSGGGDATTTTTTTTVPPPDACKDYKCTNGKKLAEGSGCKCSCFENWQGTACDEAKPTSETGTTTTTVAGATTTTVAGATTTTVPGATTTTVAGTTTTTVAGATTTTVAGATTTTVAGVTTTTVAGATTTTKAGATTTTAQTTTPAICKDYKCINGAKVVENSKCVCKCNPNWQGLSCEEASSGTTTTSAPGGKTTKTTSSGSAADPCKNYKCVNGKKSAQNKQCTCTCDTSWQGTGCDESVEEAQHGILLNMKFPQEMWTSVRPNLEKAIPKAISDYCNKNFGECCPGLGARKNPNTEYEVSSASYANVGKGYPQYLQASVSILLYVKYNSKNQLCMDGVGAARRRKRAADIYLPQDVLYNSVEQSKDTINKGLTDCCQTGVTSMEKSKVKRSAGGNAGGECDDTATGLKDWEIALIVLGVLLSLFFIIILVYFLIRSGVCHKGSKDTSPVETQMHENKVAPHSNNHSDVIVPGPKPNFDMYDDKTQYQVYM